MIALLTFLEAGGVVLWIILSLNVVLWALIFERFLFLKHSLPTAIEQVKSYWQTRTHKHSWHSLQVQRYLLSELNLTIDKRVYAIRSITLIFPLLGLLGTVTGMIEVFNVIAVSGGADAKPMAYGVSRATIPTMAGMVSAIAALLMFNFLKTISEAQKKQINQVLSLDR